MTFEEWWEKHGDIWGTDPRRQSERAWQAAQAEQAAECERLQKERDKFERWFHAQAQQREVAERERDENARELKAAIEYAERRRAQRDEAKLQCADYQRKIDELCNQAWQAVYGKDRTDWEYPAQAIRHLEQFANEQRTVKELAESSRDELRQQIAAKDEILTILRGVHAGLVDLLRSHSTMENAPPGFQDVALRSLAGEEALLARIDAALNAEVKPND